MNDAPIARFALKLADGRVPNGIPKRATIVWHVARAIEDCTAICDEVENLQDNDHGAANSGGAAQAAFAIRRGSS